MNIIGRLFEHYRAYHEYGPPRLKYMGYVGATTFTLFYFLRFTRPNPQPYDDLVLRIIAVVLFMLLALRDQWPEKLKRHYIAYSYFALLYCLPLGTVFTALERGGGMPSISNAFIFLSFLVLLTDWRNTLVMLFAGTGIAAAIYVATNPSPKMPMDLIAQIPAFALIVIGGNLFKFSTEQIDTERKLRATQALAGSIAHEMRNPLGQIRYHLERMQQALPPPATAEVQAHTLGAPEIHALYSHLSEGELAVKRGLQVIAMTLDQVGAKPVDTKAFRYLSAAQATCKAVDEYAFETVAERARVSVEVGQDFTFRGDETAYLFVLFNLLKNALYYQATCPHLHVTITVGPRRVDVRDTGPGIEAGLLAGLFQPFSSSGKSGGTGLGLAYCRRVMQAFGGEIGCESTPGEYTQFTLRFPALDDENFRLHRAKLLDDARAAFSGKRLLVVDGDAGQRLGTARKLAPLAARVDEAADAAGALEALSRRPYDLVLLDVKTALPNGEGLAEIIRLGHTPANRDVGIVALATDPADLVDVKTRRAGIDAFVCRQCDELPLVQAMQEALQQPLARGRGDTPLAGRRILIADDNPYNRKAVAAYLKFGGLMVEEADHGQAVLDHLEGPERFDAILMDLNMPHMNGLEAARAIRSSGKTWCDVPIVALTAHSGEETVQEARAAGMDHFLTKPVEAGVLYAKLGLVVNGKGARPQGPAQKPIADSGPADELLNLKRLESFRRIGMLQELLNDYLPEIGRLVETLELDVARQDMQASLDVLHSLLGMSGEAGAQALYRLVRGFYVPMLESRAWPSDAGWLKQVAAAARRADEALRIYARAEMPAAA